MVRIWTFNTSKKVKDIKKYSWTRRPFSRRPITRFPKWTNLNISMGGGAGVGGVPNEQVWTDPQWSDRDPCEKTDTNDWKHYLPATSLSAVTSEELKLRTWIVMNEFYCLKTANLLVNRILTKKLILVTRSKHLHLCLYFYSFWGSRLQRSLCYHLWPCGVDTFDIQVAFCHHQTLMI